MKYLITALLTIALGAIIFFLVFVFSEDWQRKRQRDLWNRRVKEFRADTSKTAIRKSG